MGLGVCALGAVEEVLVVTYPQCSTDRGMHSNISSVSGREAPSTLTPKQCNVMSCKQ